MCPHLWQNLVHQQVTGVTITPSGASEDLPEQLVSAGQWFWQLGWLRLVIVGGGERVV